MADSVIALDRSGAEAEAAGDTEKAIRQYEKTISKGAGFPHPFERLMILYRRRKMLKDEERVLKNGIALFTRLHVDSFGKKISSVKRAKIARLSKALGKRLGVFDKKGNYTSVPEPVNKWTRRLQLLRKRMRKK